MQLRQARRPAIPQPQANIMQVREVLQVSVMRTSLGDNSDLPSEGVSTDADLRAPALFELLVGQTHARLRLEYPEANNDRRSKSKTYRKAHTDRTRKLIVERFEKDIDLCKIGF